MFYFKNNSNGCGKFTNAYLDPEGDPDNDVSPIVLVDRGGCSFVRKTRNIQELGGALALVVDSREGKDPEQVVMIDDGTGSSIAIPTILISKADGKRLKDEVERTEASNKVNADNREFVVLMVDFELVPMFDLVG